MAPQGWWHRVALAPLEVSPRPPQLRARTLGGPNLVPGTTARRELSAGLCHGDNLGTVAEHGAFSGAARQHLTFRRGSGRGGGGVGGGTTANNGSLFPATKPRPPLRCPRCPAPVCPKAGGSWLRGGSWLWGGPEWPPDRAVLCCAMGQGVNGAPGQPLPKIWALLPRQRSPRSAPARCLAWSRDGGGTKWGLGGPPAPLAPLRRPSRGTAAIFICLNSK